MKTVKSYILAIFFILIIGPITAQQNQLTSPDGKLVVSVKIDNGVPVYSVLLNGKTFIKESPLGMETNIGDFTQELTLSESVERSEIHDSYELRNIKQSKVDYKANEAVFSFQKDDKTVLDVVFQVSNNNIAFRYKVHPQKETRSCVVNSESTGFVFPEGTTTFLCPQMKPMTGFARTAPSYETDYTLDDEMGKNGWGFGYTFPCLFKLNDAGWVLISETGVDSRYCASRLVGNEDKSYSIAYPLPEENNGNGTNTAGIPLPGYTPWRTITVGETLAPIVETTIPFEVVEPLYEASQEYKYGSGSWSWIIKMDGATTFDVQKEYIDFSAAMGFETVLVDALWDTQIGREKIEELAKYAASKDVALYLWHNSNGYWNDAPQGPRGIMDNNIIRRKEMAWMQRIGIRGIKVDFFGGDKQVTMKVYEDILYDANDYGLLVVFHGCTLPRGWERMFPNFGASEAVRASENLHFGQQSCNLEALNGCLHPFIRNAVGSMDFGGSTLNKFYNANNTPNRGSRRMTSDVYALATAVLFQSAVQHFALAPNNLTDAPEWAINFMKEVPTIWDDVRFIDGYPGKYVVLARRNGYKWYIAGINAQQETVKLNLKLPMINAGETLQFYTDDADLNGSLSSVKLNKKQEIELSIPCNGGALIVQ
ncbi:glycoside hydrolase family 97 protein [Draconibacterium halophilum]|uniref:Glycoside hydrolase family 97 protein n=1 Tax=Draconibacterium halophilum TaxID=2706887 RepID=A0A6C0RD67_9BACT|nr:glycoside hydrolase family 97 protein [Draconibacterium halophilum]QIA08079.1 glycoside hydrolase family 97 protein [Draconibacterium halophilum]